MTRQEIMQRLADKIMAAAIEALNAGDISSRDVATAVFGFGIGALKAEGVSKKDILIQTEENFDATTTMAPSKGGLS